MIAPQNMLPTDPDNIKRNRSSNELKQNGRNNEENVNGKNLTGHGKNKRKKKASGRKLRSQGVGTTGRKTGAEIQG